MSVNIGKQKRINHARIRNVQDRPVNVETHGPNDTRLSSVITGLKLAAANLRSQEQKNLFNSLIDAVEILRDNKQQFSAIRENIEILWNRRHLTDADIEESLGRIGVETPSSPGGTGGDTIINNNANDSLLFVYDLVGLLALDLPGVALPFNTSYYSHSDYFFTAGDTEVQVNKAGEYEIDVNAGFELNEGTIVEVEIQVDTGTGWNTVDGSKSYCGL
jgi:hypothetical protein